MSENLLNTASNLNQRLLSANDDLYSQTETHQLLNVLYINIVIFVALVGLFELLRNMKSVFLNRYRSKFIRTNRVPKKPSWIPFSWAWIVFSVSDDEVLRMIGLDGYMYLRFLTVCIRTACFYSFWGLIVMIPVYAQGSVGLVGWNRYTLANIPDDPHAGSLWVPVIFSYLFAIFFCQYMYFEYKNFVDKRVEYIVRGDADTPLQTYYTVLIEKLPPSLRSTTALYAFFDKLFPSQIQHVEVALDLGELEAVSRHRRRIRDALEKSIALFKATGLRPEIWVAHDLYEGLTDRPGGIPLPIRDNTWAQTTGRQILDSIEHHTILLDILNNQVNLLQRRCFEQRRVQEEKEAEQRVEVLRRRLGDAADHVGQRILTLPLQMITSTVTSTAYNVNNEKARQVSIDSDPTGSGILPPQSASSACMLELKRPSQSSNISTPDEIHSPIQSQQELITDAPEQPEGYNLNLARLMAREGLRTAEVATQGAIKGMLEVGKTVELLTLGALYRISSTAFVTLKSRQSKCAAEQMLLSHEFFSLSVQPCPNPKDIIWDNIPIPIKQITMRSSIAGVTFAIGALFWSLVVAFISAVSSLESISQELPWLQQYSDTDIYALLNNYLAISLLLILLALLPFVFDFVARSYEGLKQESEIQNSIMSRYFYYQLANVFVAVGLGSVANSLHQILENPTSILSILGASVPSFSIYFANLIIIRVCTGVPIEMLRLIPLLDILAVKVCYDKKKCTRRELRTGAFADPPMLYGWCYPNILMVVMIMFVYAAIAPFLSLLAVPFFVVVYLMYKYQLLFVYINAYQSGGFMWYAVFDYSMLSLLMGSLTLLCYLAIRQTYTSGPFYALLPLPVLVAYFWRLCNARFKGPTRSLALERAMEIDAEVTPDTVAKDFDVKLFRQPALAEGRLKPAPYRTITALDKEDKSRESTSVYDFDDEENEEDALEVDKEVNHFLETNTPGGVSAAERDDEAKAEIEREQVLILEESSKDDHDDDEEKGSSLYEAMLSSSSENSPMVKTKGSCGESSVDGEHDTKRKYGSFGARK